MSVVSLLPGDQHLPLDPPVIVIQQESFVPFADVINRMAPDELLSLRQQPRSLFTAQSVFEVTSKGV